MPDENSSLQRHYVASEYVRGLRLPPATMRTRKHSGGMQGECVLAVDGGNTKTIALVAALDGTILGAGRGGCGDIYNADPGDSWPDSATAAIANIEYAVLNALEAAKVKPSDLVTAVFSMAGADWPEDFAYIQAAMEARGFGRSTLVQNDALAALQTVLPDESVWGTDANGVSVVCGTGAATGARGPNGRIWHSSHWQNSAQGSTQLGLKTLDAVYQAELGIKPPTTLTARVLDFFHLNSIEEVLHLFTNRTNYGKRIPGVGQLTPILLDEAQAGDALALRLIQEHGQALGNYALVAARRVGIEGTPFVLVLAGGVFRHPSSLLADAVIERVRTTSPDVRPTRCRFEPIIGVLFTALEAAQVAVDDMVLEKLIPSIPDTTLFSTIL